MIVEIIYFLRFFVKWSNLNLTHHQGEWMMSPILRSIMNILKSVEGRSSNYRGFGWGALATIVAVGAITISYQVNDKESVGVLTVDSEAVAQTIKDDTKTCGHDHSGAKPEVKMISQLKISGDLDMITSKKGDTIELSFGEELTVRGEVTRNEDVVGGRKAISLRLLGQKGHLYWLQDLDGGVLGDIVITTPDEKIVYKFKTQENGWSIEQLEYKNYICTSDNKGGKSGMPISPEPFTSVLNGGVAISPTLNSLLGATSVMYLNFDGAVVTGTRWNNTHSTINAEPSGHTEAEIRSIWEEVSEDMRPFQLNVTTDRSVFDAAPMNRRMHVIITPTTDAAPGTGGVAYLNSFYDGSIDPCWVFNLSAGTCAMTCSHEVGHTFGLNHDGDPSGATYHSGNGTWGPIMGAPFGQIASWSKGEYQGANNTEDDLAIIAARSASYRIDDYGDSHAEAFTLKDNSLNHSGTVDLQGNVETTADVDVFIFSTSGGSTRLDIVPSSLFPNINLRVTLYDEAGDLVVLSENPGYSASINESLEGGVYYLHVEGVSDGSPDVSGFTDYGSLGGYSMTGSVTGLGGVIVDITLPRIERLSLFEGNGLVLEASVRGEPDTLLWLQTSGPAGGVVTFSTNGEASTRATFSAPGLYRVKFMGERDGMTDADEFSVSVERTGDTQLAINQGPVVSINSPTEFYTRQGTLKGSVVDDGKPVDTLPTLEWKVISGSATISNSKAAWTSIHFTNSEVNIVSLESFDGEVHTFKEVEVESVFEEREMLKGGQNARWYIPRDNSLGASWTMPDFDDSLWGLSDLGLGFNKNADYFHYLGETGDIQGAMKGKSPSVLIRIPFSLPSLDYVQGARFVVHYNDGFAVYLNGVAIIRRNAPEGDLAWSSTATTSRSLADVAIADEIDLSPFSAHFVQGANVLAIHGLNNSKKDAQFLIAPSMKVGVISSAYLLFTEKYGLDLLPSGDEDGDGLSNLAEHALRTDPTVPNAVNPLAPQADGSLLVELPQDMPDDVDYIVEISSNLTDWAVVASKKGKGDWVGSGLRVIVESVSPSHITYKLRSLEVAPQSFFRLKYELRGPQSDF